LAVSIAPQGLCVTAHHGLVGQQTVVPVAGAVPAHLILATSFFFIQHGETTQCFLCLQQQQQKSDAWRLQVRITEVTGNTCERLHQRVTHEADLISHVRRHRAIHMARRLGDPALIHTSGHDRLGNPPLIHMFDPLRLTHRNRTSSVTHALRMLRIPNASTDSTADPTWVQSKCKTHIRLQKCVGSVHSTARFAHHSTPQASATMDSRSVAPVAGAVALDPHKALCGALWTHSVSMALGIHSLRTQEESLTQTFFNESFSLHLSMAFHKLPF